MLRLKTEYDDIEIRFDYKICDPHFIEKHSGITVSEDRRCSLASLKINGQDISEGMVICHPNDNFKKSTGRKKALSYALSSLDKSVRRLVWAEYKLKCKF